MDLRLLSRCVLILPFLSAFFPLLQEPLHLDSLLDDPLDLDSFGKDSLSMLDHSSSKERSATMDDIFSELGMALQL